MLLMNNIQSYTPNLKRYGLNHVFSNSNSKLNKDSIWSFGIPAYKSVTGKITCPSAGECKNYCYAKKGNYLFKNVKSKQEKLLELTYHSEDFVSICVAEIIIKNIKWVRIHDSGDFYSKKYFQSWIDICNSSPDTTFYSYTKSHFLVDALKDVIPKNLIIIKSAGSVKDSIDYTLDRHAVVFDSVVSLIQEGYELASISDTVAFQSENRKIGLLYNFKSQMLKYSKEYANYYGLDYKDVFNTWVVQSGSKKKILI